MQSTVSADNGINAHAPIYVHTLSRGVTEQQHKQHKTFSVIAQTRTLHITTKPRPGK